MEKKTWFLSGNNASTRIKFGRYRANHGVVLLGDGKGNFSYLGQQKSGLSIRNDIRSAAIIIQEIEQQYYLVRTMLLFNPIY